MNTTTKEAIVVNDVYKKFGKPGPPLWKRALKIKLRANGNGTQNGDHKKERSSLSTMFPSKSMKVRFLVCWGQTALGNPP